MNFQDMFNLVVTWRSEETIARSSTYKYMNINIKIKIKIKIKEKREKGLIIS